MWRTTCTENEKPVIFVYPQDHTNNSQVSWGVKTPTKREALWNSIHLINSALTKKKQGIFKSIILKISKVLSKVARKNL